MVRPFVPRDPTRRSYHSGITGRILPTPQEARRFALVDQPRTIRFETGRYRPPQFEVTIRTSVDGWNEDILGDFQDGEWVFSLPGDKYKDPFDMKFRLNRPSWKLGDKLYWMLGDNVHVDKLDIHCDEGWIRFVYEVRLQTDLWRPNHLITLRNEVDGWGRDLYGTFHDSTWSFQLDPAFYPDPFQAKFVLERSWFMDGPNLPLDPGAPGAPDGSSFTDAEVHFPTGSPAPSAYVHGYDNFLPVDTPLQQITVHMPGREAEDYDVIVIGSGMGGGTLADDLSDRGARTLVLDAGGLWFPVHMNDLPGADVDLAQRDQLGHFTNEPGSQFLFGVNFNLGGRSVYWSGVIPRMRPWEMRGVWPDAVRTYLFDQHGYERAEHLFRPELSLGPFEDRVRVVLSDALPDFHVHPLPRSLHQPNLVAHHGRYCLDNVLRKTNGVFSTADLLLDSAGFAGPAGQTNLRINLHHLVTRIETSQGQATAVVCQDLAGNVERRYHAKKIVIACGSLESPKLALLSGLEDPNRLIGVGLSDHPTYFYNIHHDLPTSGSLGWLGDLHGHAKILMQHKHSSVTRHPYNIELLINSRYWDARHADEALWNQIINNDQPSQVEMKFIFGRDLDDSNYVKLGDPPTGKTKVLVHPDGPEYVDELELLEVRNRILTALGVTRFSTTWMGGEWGLGFQGTVHHAGGSLRMNADGRGVVDEDLKFLRYDNLYCCDNSVFPTILAANPSLTLVALALRLADTLAADLGLPDRDPAHGS